MSKAFKFALMALCCAVMSVVCWLWARAVAGETGPDDVSVLLPTVACAAFFIGACGCAIESVVHAGCDDASR